MVFCVKQICKMRRADAQLSRRMKSIIKKAHVVTTRLLATHHNIAENSKREEVVLRGQSYMNINVKNYMEEPGR